MSGHSHREFRELELEIARLWEEIGRSQKTIEKIKRVFSCIGED